MKKIALLLLAFVLTVNLCACGGLAQKAPAEENAETQQNAQTQEDAATQESAPAEQDPAAKYVGTWVSTSKPISGLNVHSIRLLPSGKAIWSYYGNDGVGVVVTEEDAASSGEWELDENRILVYYTYSIGSGDGVIIFDILTEKTLSMGQATYLREE